MRMRLAGVDLLFVGFWSDWNYLNAIFAAVLEETGPAWVMLVDPGGLGWLAAKAPQLSAIAGDADKFVHEQMSGDVFLEELRVEFSRMWVRRFYGLGVGSFEAQMAAICPPAFLEPLPLSAAELYDVRRDSEGVPLTRVAVTREPPMSATAAAYAHLLLRNAGAVAIGSWWSFGGKTLRVVNGGGRSLPEIREDFEEPGAMPAADVVICAGAFELGLPGHILRRGVPGGIVRPAPYAEWLTLEEARARLGF
jgi:hypothetical protein